MGGGTRLGRCHLPPCCFQGGTETLHSGVVQPCSLTPREASRNPAYIHVSSLTVCSHPLPPNPAASNPGRACPVQGYLSRKKQHSTSDRHRALGIFLLQGPRRAVSYAQGTPVLSAIPASHPIPEAVRRPRSLLCGSSLLNQVNVRPCTGVPRS